jgi:hypothetical protein
MYIENMSCSFMFLNILLVLFGIGGLVSRETGM